MTSLPLPTAIRPGNLLCKYADDTYLIIPSINVDTRLDELANVEEWSRKNNLTLNRSKSQEIIFIDRRRKRNGKYNKQTPINTNNKYFIASIFPVLVATSGHYMKKNSRN